MDNVSSLAEQCNKDKDYSFGVLICDARMTVLFGVLGNNLLLLLENMHNRSVQNNWEPRC